MTEHSGAVVTQGTSVGKLMATLQNEWTMTVASQSMTENAGATVSQNEWTLAITSQKYVQNVQNVDLSVLIQPSL